MRVMLQDNLWFTGPPGFANYERNGQSMIPVEPLLGRTASSDAGVKEQELQWLLRYTGRTGTGLVVAQEWIKPDHRIEENLPLFLEVFGRHARQGRWCIFYDPVLAFRQRGFANGPPFDLSTPELLQLWREDLTYLERHFEHPKYHRIGGRPVLYVWAVHGGVFNADTAFREADAQGIYVLGDVFGGPHDPQGMSGATGFVSVLPGRGGGDIRLVDEALPQLEEEYDRWAGRDLIPAGSLQYDDTVFQRALGGGGAPPTRILASSRQQVEFFLNRLEARAEIGHLFLGTANNWAEGTTVLPTVRGGQRFRLDRLGNYNFEHLQAIRNAIFPGVREYTGPRIDPRRGSAGQAAADLKDFDIGGKLRVAPRGATHSIKVFRGFKQRWRGEPGAKLTLVNLDGKRTSRVVG